MPLSPMLLNRAPLALIVYYWEAVKMREDLQPMVVSSDKTRNALLDSGLGRMKQGFR